MLNQAYNPLGCQVKLFPVVRDADCLFCQGTGELFTIHGDEEFSSSCQACYGTGKDDPELYLIMSGKLVPPVVEAPL